MKKLSFDNSWMTLWQASMSKLHLVIYFCPQAEERIKQRGFVLVANHGENEVIAEQYASIYSSRHVEEWKGEYKMLIQSDGQMFEVIQITEDIENMNVYLADKPEAGIIATDHLGRHYAALVKPSISIGKLNELQKLSTP